MNASDQWSITICILGALVVMAWVQCKILLNGFYEICNQIKYSREEILREFKSIDDSVKGSSENLRDINDRLKRISEHLGAEMSDAKRNKLISEAGKNGDEAEKTFNQQKTMVREADLLIEEFEKIISETEK